MSFKKLLSLVLVFAVTLSMLGVLAGCAEKNTPEETTTSPTEEVSGETAVHTIRVRTQGGMAIPGIDVYVYMDDSLTDLAQFGETDENGQVSVNLVKGRDYAIVLSGVSKGYAVEAYYRFTGTASDITLTSELVQDESLSSVSLGLGDVMYDFSVVDSNGNTVTLSEMLAEKDMVLINFFYTTCGPCANEFPYMEEAYQLYKDSVGIIALDPLDDANTVATYQTTMGLTFPMAACQIAWASTFGVTGYPTSIVVDRYGVICLIEVGGITSLRPFVSIFDHFSGDDYEQKICYNGASDVITTIKPTYEMPSSEDIAAAINNGDIPVTYHPETDEDSAEFTWPFIITEKNGEVCLKASNQGIDDSYAILYADVELKAGQAVGFDYLISSEQGMDAMVVIVDGEDIYQMSGVDQVETWKSCYPWVAIEDGTYEVALCYLKDEGDNVGDDTVYIKNMRIQDVSEIDSATLPRQAASTEDGFTYSYVDIVLNETDGYYHVGTTDGPLLLANLLNYSQFNEEETVWEMVYGNGLTLNGVDFYTPMETYCNYASNSNMLGYCTVTEELAQLLGVVDEIYGFDSADEYEWLKACTYYQVYGTEGKQQEDPIAGLAPFSAYTATLGTNVSTNYFYYNRIIMPRGLLAEFVPEKSGVYRITSHNESTDGVDGWIFDEKHRELLTYEMDERMFTDSNEVSMVLYMEAGKSYFIDIAFWDPYEVGFIYYDVEYIAPTLNHFRLCAPGYFSYDSDATGDAMYHLIALGVDVVLGEDGIYYEDLGDGRKGSKIYCDFTGLTTLFGNPIATVPACDENGDPVLDENGKPVMVKGMIDMGGFDFSKTEDDLYVLSVLEAQGGDADKAIDYLKTYWGNDYDAYAELYQLEDVLAGEYHGKGQDLTDEIRAYMDKIITTGSKECHGCVIVDERLAEILQMLMDKYTFANVDHSWIKLCYYYDYLGPEA